MAGNEKAASVKLEFPVVGVGSSAGGLEAMRELLENLSNDTGMAIVFITHLSPEHKSALVEILSKSTKMPVSEAVNDTPLKPNHVYIIPPNRDLTIENGVFKLGPISRTELPHLPIDHFLTSLAAAKKNRAIGVILSGTGSDGTKGLEAIKAEGGITYTQQEDTAKFPEMPRNAVASGNVDYTLSPQGIAQSIHNMKPKLEVLANLADESEETTKTIAYQQVISLLKKRTKVDFTHYRRSTLHRRISRRMLLRSVTRIEDYAKLLAKDGGEIDNLFQDILINVTAFYRDPEAFEALKKNVLPKLLSGREASRPLRVWVPGCSTGEEAYTIAFCIVEYLGDNLDTGSVQIFATDVNEAMINKARTGVYNGNSMENVSKARLHRFFSQSSGEGWQVKKIVRDMVVFAKHNVLADPPFANMDIISCRNLLIYFDETFQDYVIPFFHYALKPSGFLMLGKSESVSRFKDLFEVVDKENKIYSKKMTPNNRIPVFTNFQPTDLTLKELPQPRATVKNLAKTLEKEAERILVEHAPPGVMVNDDLEIIHFQGRTSPFIEPAPGAASLNLEKMARGTLPMKLKAAVDQARKGGRRVKLEGVRFSLDGDDLVDVEVIPLEQRPDSGRFYLVLFKSHTPRRLSTTVGVKTLAEEERTELERLRGETEEMRRFMQTSIEEKEAANEELKSANEELQASFEELQSINEELQTSREELQASNEELRTLNDELQSRNKEVSDFYNVVENLINSAHLPMIMVDNSLNIKRITPSAKSAFNILLSDVGRPLSDLKLKLDITNLTEIVQDTISSLRPRSMEVTDVNGHWYKMEVQLYRTTENRIEGAVITFIDIDNLKLGEASTRRLSTVLGQSSDAITTLDTSGRFMTWNKGAEAIYGYTANEAIGKSYLDFVEQGSRDEARALIDRVVAGETISEAEVKRVTKHGRVITVSLRITGQVDSKGKIVSIAMLERLMP